MLLAIESSVIAAVFVQPGRTAAEGRRYISTGSQSLSATFQDFNQPISNDTDYHLRPVYNGSWAVTMTNSLATSPNETASEAQVAISPEYRVENLSIPTIIVQARGDGLVRVEYFAQDWKNTYGLLLYNSTGANWSGGESMTLRFISFGPPSQVNPQLAPRPNGNLTVTIGSAVVVSDYPIAWANLGAVYLYGYPGSSFRSGAVTLSFQSLEEAK